MLVGLFPALLIWLTNKNIPKILPDFLILFFPFWVTIALASHYGFGFGAEAGGMFFIETVGPYFIARILVQNADRFEQIMKWLIAIVIVLLPFALIEAITRREILIELFRVFGSTYSIVVAPERLGFDRVQGPFEHPIHFGVYCGAAISFAFYYKEQLQSIFYRAFRACIVLFTALGCLSSGPLTGISAQIMIIAYDLATRSITLRWRYLMIGVAVLWVIVDLLSNRTPPEVFITYFALSAHTAYNRIYIWKYGTESIANNPLLGIGYEEYARPEHVYSASVDMFWILPSMQFGIPAGFALLGVFIYIVIKVGLAKIADPRVATLRKSLMICFLGAHLVGLGQSITGLQCGPSFFFFLQAASGFLPMHQMTTRCLPRSPIPFPATRWKNNAGPREMEAGKVKQPGSDNRKNGLRESALDIPEECSMTNARSRTRARCLIAGECGRSERRSLLD